MKGGVVMTPRENLLNFFHGKEYEWIPSNLDTRSFQPLLNVENKARGFVDQQDPLPPEQFGGTDWFGVEWIYDPNCRGSIEKKCLLDDPDDLLDWETKIVFPDISKLDWEGCARDNSEYLDTDLLLTTTIFTGYFERLISFVGFENAAMALIEDDLKEAVHGLFDRLTEFYIEIARRFHDYFGVQYLTLHDDWGTQRSLMFSEEVHKEMLMPYIRRVTDAVHELGMIYEQHSCGLIGELIPNLIDSGADTWRGQPVNDKEELVRLYGDRFRFIVDASIPPHISCTDEEALACLANNLERYKDKEVYYFLLPSSSPELKEKYHELLLKATLARKRQG